MISAVGGSAVADDGSTIQRCIDAQRGTGCIPIRFRAPTQEAKRAEMMRAEAARRVEEAKQADAEQFLDGVLAKRAEEERVAKEVQDARHVFKRTDEAKRAVEECRTAEAKREEEEKRAEKDKREEEAASRKMSINIIDAQIARLQARQTKVPTAASAASIQTADRSPTAEARRAAEEAKKMKEATSAEKVRAEAAERAEEKKHAEAKQAEELIANHPAVWAG